MKHFILLLCMYIGFSLDCWSSAKIPIEMYRYHRRKNDHKANNVELEKFSLATSTFTVTFEDNHLDISELSGKQVEIKVKNDSEKEVYTSIPMYVTSPAIIELGTLPHGSYTLEITVDDCVYQGKCTL